MPGLPYDVGTLRFELDQLKSLDQILPWAPGRFNELCEDLEKRVYADLDEGFNREVISVRHVILARYGGQLWELGAPCPVGRISSIEDLKEIIKAFEEEYLRVYTKEAMVPRGGWR